MDQAMHIMQLVRSFYFFPFFKSPLTNTGVAGKCTDFPQLDIRGPGRDILTVDDATDMETLAEDVDVTNLQVDASTLALAAAGDRANDGGGVPQCAAGTCYTWCICA